MHNLAVHLNNNYLEIVQLTWSIKTLRANNSGSKMASFKEYLLGFIICNDVSCCLIADWSGGNLP